MDILVAWEQVQRSFFILNPAKCVCVVSDRTGQGADSQPAGGVEAMPTSSCTHDLLGDLVNTVGPESAIPSPWKK